MRVRDRFLQLIRNRLHVRRAIPAIVHLRWHGFGIAARERIFGLGKRTQVNAADSARPAQNLLSESKRSYDLLIFGVARGENAADAMLLSGDADRVPRLAIQLSGEALAEKNILRVVGGPASIYFPPAVSNQNAGGEFLLTKSKRL